MSGVCANDLPTGRELESSLQLVAIRPLGVGYSRAISPSNGQPKSNGQAEATNKAILSGLKKRLEGAKGRWAEELLSVLWAYRTTPRRSTGETPFSLTYRAEAVIPAEVNLCSTRVARFTSDENEKLMVKELNLLEKHRDVAAIRLAEYQQKLV
ncbi:uncharacterized protein LOC142635542 [Castanea sativa]|uniref:uncharacterized protein LOC142635542 n=1 Tax=Castanea sativa TaxID=21020 RepID=UPI003F64C45E